MKLEKDDILLLDAMQRDARRSFRDLAHRTGLSTPTVSAKVKSFEEMGLIQGYQTIFNTELLGETTVFLLIKAKPSELEAVGRVVQIWREVREIYLLSGSRLICKATVTDANALNLLISRISQVKEIMDYNYYTTIEPIKEEPRAILEEGVNLQLNCYYCDKLMLDKHIKIKLDNRDHYLCCPTCVDQYRKKYDRIAEGARREKAKKEEEAFYSLMGKAD